VRAFALLVALLVAPSGPASAQPATQAEAAPVDDRSCAQARKKVAREQRTAAEAADTLAKARRARETCVSRSACARYDEAIRDALRRQGRQATRFARFEHEVAAACAR
jgi:hypothetical protein